MLKKVMGGIDVQVCQKVYLGGHGGLVGVNAAERTTHVNRSYQNLSSCLFSQL